MRFFNSLKLYGKLLTAFAVMMVLTVVVGIIGIWSLSSMYGVATKMYTSELMGVRYIKDTRLALASMGRAARSVILAPDAGQREVAIKEVARQKEAVTTNLAGAKPLFYVKANLERLEEFGRRFERYSALVEQVSTLASTGNAESLRRAAKLQLEQGAPLGSAAEEILAEAAGVKMKVAQAAADNAGNTFQSIRTFIVGSVLACVVLGLLLGRYIAKVISDPINRLTMAAEGIARGDIEQVIDHHSEDETGRLADSFRSMVRYIDGVSAAAQSISKGDLGVTISPQSDKDQLSRSFLNMVSYIQGIAAAAEALGRGDLTVTIAAQSDKDVLSSNFNRATESLRAVISQISVSSSTLSSASQELTTVATQISSNSGQTSAEAKTVAVIAQQLNQNIHTVASSAEEMSSSIKEIARSAHEASRVALDAVKLSQETNVTVIKLGDSSFEVGNVIKVITSVAQQTKLLALNATIEAASAGEAGKGFAVVASEVKELAKETANATDDIGRKIEAIQTDTRNAVDAIGTITGIVGQINTLQLTTSSAVEEQAATTAEISRNVSEAAIGASEIARSISEVAKAADGMSSGAADAQKAAAELANMAVSLMQLVGKFKYA